MNPPVASRALGVALALGLCVTAGIYVVVELLRGRPLRCPDALTQLWVFVRAEIVGAAIAGLAHRACAVAPDAPAA